MELMSYNLSDSYQIIMDIENAVEVMNETQLIFQNFTMNLLRSHVNLGTLDKNYVALRNDFTLDVISYFKFVTPISTKALGGVRDFVEHFELGYSNVEDFLHDVPNLITDAEEINHSLTFLTDLQTMATSNSVHHQSKAKTIYAALQGIETEKKEEVKNYSEKVTTITEELDTYKRFYWPWIYHIPIYGDSIKDNHNKIKTERMNDLENTMVLQQTAEEQLDVLARSLASMIDHYGYALDNYQSGLRMLHQTFILVQNELKSIKNNMAKTEENVRRATLFFNKALNAAKRMAKSIKTYENSLGTLRDQFIDTVPKALKSQWDNQYDRGKLSLAYHLEDAIDKEAVRTRQQLMWDDILPLVIKFSLIYFLWLFVSQFEKSFFVIYCYCLL
jgi:uncharacterized protein YukE